jgi:hypothetical protein
MDTLPPVQARNLMTALVVYQGDTWRPLMAKYIDLAENVLNLQQLSDREARNWVDAATIRKMIRRMREDVKTHKLLERMPHVTKREKRLLMAYIAFSIHNIFHLRNDLPSLNVVAVSSLAQASHSNYYVRSTGVIHLWRFKTYSYFRRRGLLPLKLQLPNGIRKLINAFVFAYDHEKILGRITRPAYNNLLVSHSERYLAVRIGSTMLRHIYLSEFLKRDPSLKQKQRKLQEMQQLRLETQERYRRISAEEWVMR